MSNAPSPLDDFKRSLGAAAKALAGNAADRELDVRFGGEAAGVTHNGDETTIILPAIPPNPKAPVIAKARGEADAIALRMALHDEAVFAQNLPKPGPARAICEALEQARVEALGAKFMDGVGDNLYAAQDARCARRGFAQKNLSQSDAPLAEAVGVWAREVFTGRPAPDGASGLMGAWRQALESSAADEIGSLADALTDQGRYGKLAQDLLRALDMGDDLAEPERTEESEEESRESEENNPQNAQDDSQESEPGAAQLAEADALDDEDQQAQDSIDTEDMDGETEGEQSPDETAQRPQLTNARPPYSIYTKAYDEILKAEDLCDADELSRLRSEPEYNARLGSAYLAGLSKRYKNNPVLMSIGYNAGPSRADRWEKAYGNPRNENVDIVDWIEGLPFNETRNYVMRVTESFMPYRARLTGELARSSLTRDLRL